MSFYRNVDQRVWGDRKFRSLSANARLLWLYLLTGPHVGPVPGLSCVGRAGLAEALGWDLSAFDACFSEIASKGMAESDWDARVVWLPNAVKHNEPDSENNVAGWQRYLETLPDSELTERATRTILEQAREMLARRASEKAEERRKRGGGSPPAGPVAGPAGGPPGGPPPPPPAPPAEAGEGEGEGKGKQTERSSEERPAPSGASSADADGVRPGGLTPESLAALWDEHVATKRGKVDLPLGKVAKRARAALKRFPTEADWLPGFANAKRLRDETNATWLDFAWFVHEEAAGWNLDQLNAGKFDFRFDGAGPPKLAGPKQPHIPKVRSVEEALKL